MVTTALHCRATRDGAAFLVSLFFSVFGIPHASADITKLVEATVEMPAKGPTGTVSATIVLENVAGQDLLVQLIPSGRSLLGMEDRIDRKRAVVLRAKDRTKLTAPLAITSAPKQILSLVVIAANRGGAIIGTQPIAVYLRVEDNVYIRSTYEELYLPPRGASHSERPTRSTLPVLDLRKIKASISPTTTLSGRKQQTLDQVEMQSHQLPEMDLSHYQNSKTRALLSQYRQSSLASHNAQRAFETGTGLQTHNLPPVPSARTQNFTVSGEFYYLGIVDANWHPGWNWLVHLTGEADSGGVIDLGSQYVLPNGKWSITVSDPRYSGKTLMIEYRPGGSYLMALGPDDREYWWSSMLRNNIPTTYFVGNEGADTSAAGWLAGLGNIYESGMELWNAFVNAGVNPWRAAPIQLHFPNLAHDCEPPKMNIWSCASPAGEIWLIPVHANTFTIQHELAHQLNFEFWNNIFPPDSGGAHVVDTCVSPGLALTEGFANAVPQWVMNPPNAPTPAVAGELFFIETPPASYCEGDWNEAWVAATFWDLIDTHSDGLDTFGFTNSVLPLSVYLALGVQPSLREFRPVYNFLAAPTGIDDVYSQNHIALD
jgi:hypothetical protein